MGADVFKGRELKVESVRIERRKSGPFLDAFGVAWLGGDRYACAMKMLTVYAYSGCSTCKKATAWLEAHGIAFQEKAIRETPPGVDELRTMLAAAGGDVRKLCNTSGRDYRERKLGGQLAVLPVDEVLELLAANGNLVRRPFVLGDGVALVGFKETEWSAALLG